MFVQDEECCAACVLDLSSSRAGPDDNAECESFPVDADLFSSHPGLLILQVSDLAMTVVIHGRAPSAKGGLASSCSWPPYGAGCCLGCCVP